jgi:hypothetical protein
MTSRTDKPALVIVHDGSCCIGFVLNRGPMGHEAVDPDGRSVAFFASVPEAAAALFKLWPRAAS